MPAECVRVYVYLPANTCVRQCSTHLCKTCPRASLFCQLPRIEWNVPLYVSLSLVVLLFRFRHAFCLSLGIVARICVTFNYPSFVLSWHYSCNLFNKQAISPCFSPIFSFFFVVLKLPAILLWFVSKVPSFLIFGACLALYRQLVSLSWRDLFSSVVSLSLL